MNAYLSAGLATLRERGPFEFSKRAYRRSVSADSLLSLKASWYRLQGHAAVGDVTELATLPTDMLTHRINTECVEKSLPKEYAILGGEWDRHAKPFETDPKYRYIRRYHENGTPPDRTAILPEWEKSEDHREGFERLYEEIQKNGYRTQRELPDGGDIFDEINVCFGRDGRGIVKHGHHRASIAKVLGISTVPVYVRARHVVWQRLRNEIWEADSVDELSDAARETLDHPDMAAAKRTLDHLEADTAKRASDETSRR